MSFRRSDVGVSNYKYFFDVDYIAYVEGSSDVGYWQHLFSKFRPDLRIKFEKADGVENLPEIVSALLAGSIKNTIVCRDADYLPFIGELPTHSRILRTYGYSFENDFITPEAATAIATLIAPDQINEEFVKRAFRRYMFKLSQVGEWLLRLDVRFSATGYGLIDRQNPRDLFDGSDVCGYEFSEPKARQRIAARGGEIAAAQIDFGQHGGVYPRYFCGHSVFFVLLVWCRATVKRRIGRIENAKNSVIRKHLISHYDRVVAPSTREFMESQLAAI